MNLKTQMLASDLQEDKGEFSVKAWQDMLDAQGASFLAILNSTQVLVFPLLDICFLDKTSYFWIVHFLGMHNKSLIALFDASMTWLCL